MSIVLLGSTSGSVTLQEPAVAGTSVLTLPVGTGTAVVNGVNSAVVSGTAVSASSTSVDFTSIPSWVKRITVLLNDVSTNGSSNIIIQLGDSGGVETTGYQCKGTTNGATTDSTTGFLVAYAASASYIYVAKIDICLVTGTTYIASGTGLITALNITSVAGNKTLSATLDRIRITTENGTDAFDAGTINILYE